MSQHFTNKGARTFTVNRDVPVFFNVEDREVALMIPAGFRLAVIQDLGEDDDEEDPFHDDDDDLELDEGVWVHLQGDGEAWLPSEAGTHGDVEPNDIESLRVRSPEDVLLEVRRRHAEFSWLYEDIEELDEELQQRAEDEVQAERDREAEVLWDIEEKEGRFSRAYLKQLKLTPHAVALACVTELAEFYDDDHLRHAARKHPDLDLLGAFESGKQAAVQGAVGRMLIAEVITNPGARQVDLAAAMNVPTDFVSSIAYQLGLADFLHRSKEANRVLLSPGDRCVELGLDLDAASALIAGRPIRADQWRTVMDGVRVPSPPEKDSLDDYGYSEYL